MPFFYSYSDQFIKKYFKNLFYVTLLVKLDNSVTFFIEMRLLESL